VQEQINLFFIYIYILRMHALVVLSTLSYPVLF
jgi:hypothetical protein